jgi:N6-adenosine-specific RNA methylase IME4
MNNIKYEIIYCDPPWQFSNKKTGGSMKSGAAHHYLTTGIEGLKALDVNSISADNCTLIMWWVGSMPQEAIDLVNSWGFIIKNMNGFVWNKLTVKNKPFFGMGFRTRAGSESAIIAIKGKPGVLSHSVRAVHSFVVGKHSKKPVEFRDLIVELCGDLPRLEMFARESAEGWHVFGNEAPNSINIKAK